jgi:hypothetical protein
MNKLILIIYLLFYAACGFADTPFSELFDDENIDIVEVADRVTTYHAESIALSYEEKHTELRLLNKKIQSAIKTSGNNPVYWFIAGLNESNLASLASQNNQPTAASKHIDNKNHAYQQAILLDKKNTPHLSSAMYATMKHGLPESLKIDAIKQEVDLGGNAPNESYYWQLHWSLVNSLEQAERFDEAATALSNMKQKMAEQNIKDSDYNKIVDRAEKELTQSRKQYEARQQRIEQQKHNHKEKDYQSIILWSITIFAIVSIISVTLYEVIRKKK